MYGLARHKHLSVNHHKKSPKNVTTMSLISFLKCYIYKIIYIEIIEIDVSVLAVTGHDICVLKL